MALNAVTRRFYRFGEFHIDVKNRLLLRRTEIIPLTSKAFDLLLIFVENPGTLLEKEELMERVWGSLFVEEANLARNVSSLRKALGENHKTPEYIVTVTGHGYRFVADVEDLSDADASQTAQELPLPTHQPPLVTETQSAASSGKAFSAHRIAYTSTAVAIVALTLAALVYLTRAKVSPNASPAPTSVAVLPFKLNINGERDQGLEIGMAEAIINKLRTVRQLSVQPLGIVRRYGDLNQDPIEFGREIGVDTVLESTLRESAAGVSLASRLVRVKDGETLWSFRSEETQNDLQALQNLLSEKVASSLVATLTSEQRQILARQHTRNPEAYRLYLKGRFFFDKVTPDGVRKSIDYYQQAIDKDPEFALAYTGMCASYTLFGNLRVLPPREVHPAAKAALARALELNSSLSEAHSQAGFLALHYDYDWDRADKEFARAIELDKNSPSAHHGRAFYLAAVGKPEESLSEIRRALDLEPVSLHLNADAGVLLYYARHQDEAIAQLRKTLEMGPGFMIATRYLARVYAFYKLDALSAEEYGKSSALFGGKTADEARIAKAFSDSGLRGYYRFELDRLKNRAKSQYVPALDFARLYALMEDRDNAIEWIGKAIEERHYAVPFLNVDPDFDSLRSDPRLVSMLQRIGLNP